MLEELRALLGACRPDATRTDYLAAILEENCLGKRTTATQKLSAQRLSELYALDPKVPVFSVLRRCWYADTAGQPLLAMLLSLARDPLLRLTAPAVLGMQPGEELSRQRIGEALRQTVGHRLSESTQDKVIRNASSSWTQSGHLEGRGHKIRQLAHPTPVTTTYALFLGHLEGRRGADLFESLWARVLDAPVSELMGLASDARRLGFLDLIHSGGIIEVGFTRLLT